MFRIRLFILVVLLILGTACSNKFFYNQLDWLIPWYVDDYVDLTFVQKENLDKQVEMLLQWHRGEELSHYIEILNYIEKDVTEDVTVATVKNWFDVVLIAAKRVQINILPSAIKLGEKLTEEQMAEFVKNLWVRQAELEEEYLSRSNEEYIENNYESLTDNLGKYVGRLSDAQKQRLNKAARSMQRFDHVWLEDRSTWLEKVEDLMKREQGWQQDTIDAFAKRGAQQPKRFKQYLSYNTSIINEAIADVINQLSDKQRGKLLVEIAEIKNDFRVIIASAE
ncbi:MAG: hypothetical protein ACI9N9_001297 [Enterobacterales bacterium]|jgi:hypothetical protein